GICEYCQNFAQTQHVIAQMKTPDTTACSILKCSRAKPVRCPKMRLHLRRRQSRIPLRRSDLPTLRTADRRRQRPHTPPPPPAQMPRMPPSPQTRVVPTTKRQPLMLSMQDFLAELEAIPKLDGARCKSKSDLWDETEDPEIVEYTKSHCLACPSLIPCRNWAATQTRLHGVVAGEIRYHHKAIKKRKSA